MKSKQTVLEEKTIISMNIRTTNEKETRAEAASIPTLWKNSTEEKKKEEDETLYVYEAFIAEQGY